MCATRPDPEGRAMMTPIPAVDKPTELPPEDPWVRRMAELLEEACRSLPGVSQEVPWSKESLDAAEQAFLDRQQHLDPFDEELYIAFLGGGLIRLYGGYWVSLKAASPNGDTERGYGISYDGAEHTDVVSSMTTIAELFGTGTHWSTSYATTKQLLQK